MKLFSRMFVVLFGTAALVMACAPVSADSVLIGAWTKHVISGNFNEQHDLFAYKRGNYSAGTFINSYNRRTYFVGYSPERLSYKSELFDAGIDLVLTHGYRKCFGDDNSGPDLCPAAVPYLDLKAGSSIHPRFFILGPAPGVSIKVDF